MQNNRFSVKNYTLFLMVTALVMTNDPCALAGLVLEGDFVQGGLIRGRVDPLSRVQLDGKRIEVSESGNFIIGFGRDSGARHRLKVIAPDGSFVYENIHISRRDFPVERIDGISERMMHPTEEELERIRFEADLIAAVRSRVSRHANFLEPFIWPVTGRISGVYGSQRTLNGEPRRPHYGIDIAASPGTPVLAPAGGIVRLAYADMFFSGKTLILDHGFGLSSSFLHLQEILVKEGDPVAQGQPIARVGATGRVTGPHLDWRVNWFEQRLDPGLLVPPMPNEVNNLR